MNYADDHPFSPNYRSASVEAMVADKRKPPPKPPKPPVARKPPQELIPKDKP